MTFLAPIISVFLASLITTTFQFELSIIHFNDFHARYEPVSNTSGTCSGPECIGGFSRLYATIGNLKKPNSLVLNAGDNFKGSLWHTVYKWNVSQHFLNKLPLDAITLGNHDFDDGVQGLVPFLQMLTIPVVLSNLNHSLHPELDGLYQNNIIIHKNGRDIGIIGLVLTETEQTSHTENLTFLDELTTMNNEAAKLKDQVLTIILISHCGYQTDLILAANSKHVSVIVGGHTDTFLYTGSPAPGPDLVSGPYPTPVLNKLGKIVLVVQASAYSKYLGDLNVLYDDAGNVKNWSGAPIFLHKNLPTNSEIDKELELWKEKVDLEGNRILGMVITTMPNKPCRSGECFLGNFAADAIMSWFTVKNASISAAILHAGGLRSGIEIGNVSFNQLITVFPFDETINSISLQGKYIRELFENCVTDKNLNNPHLFQLSVKYNRLQVIYNTTLPEKHRIVSLKLTQKTGLIEIDPEETYRLAMPAFLTDSGFNSVIKQNQIDKSVGPKDHEVYASYLSQNTPFSGQLDNRIIFL